MTRISKVQLRCVLDNIIRHMFFEDKKIIFFKSEDFQEIYYEVYPKSRSLEKLNYKFLYFNHGRDYKISIEAIGLRKYKI